MLKLQNKQSGFTIIEVVLVLAIAGLIFLAVFLALPQLQASQRDSTRKTDAGRLIAAINQYAANETNGIAPADAGVVGTDVVGGGYIDDFDYEVSATATALESSSGANGEAMLYERAVDCDGSPTNNRTFAVSAPQEGGPDYCQEG